MDNLSFVAIVLGVFLSLLVAPAFLALIRVWEYSFGVIWPAGNMLDVAGYIAILRQDARFVGSWVLHNGVWQFIGEDEDLDNAEQPNWYLPGWARWSSKLFGISLLCTFFAWIAAVGLVLNYSTVSIIILSSVMGFLLLLWVLFRQVRWKVTEYLSVRGPNVAAKFHNLSIWVAVLKNNDYHPSEVQSIDETSTELEAL